MSTGPGAKDLEGAAVAGVSLRAWPDRTRPCRIRLEACAAPAGTGGEDVEHLLALWGDCGFETVRETVLDALQHPVADPQCPGVTIADRRAGPLQLPAGEAHGAHGPLVAQRILWGLPPAFQMRSQRGHWTGSLPYLFT